MATEYEKAEETYQLYRYDRDNGHDVFLDKAEEAQRYYASQQWSPEDRYRRMVEKRPMVVVNEIFETVNSIAGELSQLSTDVRYQADHRDDEETAAALNKLSAHTDRQNRMYMHDDRVRRDGLLLGRGFYEIRMDYDDNMMGNVKVTTRRPQNVILPCDMDSPDPGEWPRITTTDVVSLQDIEQMYGKAVAKDMRGMPLAPWYEMEDRNLAELMGFNTAYRSGEFAMDSTNPYLKQYRLISMQYKELKEKEFFIDLQTGDTSEIPENWPREKIQYALDSLGLGTITRKTQTMRWRVVANDRVLHDEDSPYKYFTIVPYMPYFIDGVPLSLFEVLKGPQDLLNKALSEEIHIMSTVANSGWKVKAGSLRNMTMRDLKTDGAKNGLVMELDDISDAERITPASPPAGFQDLSNRAQGWVKQLAGLTPSMQGAQRADAAGEGIRMQLMRAPVNMAVALTAFHFTKHLLAERKLNLYQTFYTETRIMRTTVGQYGQQETFGINVPVGDRIVNDVTLGSYSINILPTGSRMQAEEFAFDELIKLRELGVSVPNDLLIEVSAINAKADAAERLREANSGELSPEEQRARELELAQMELEVEDKAAAVENKRALTDLSMARADRARADAQTPQARIALDANRQRLEAERDARNDSLQREKQTTDVALELTKLETEREKEAIKAEAAKAAAKAQPKKPTSSKPVTKKPAATRNK